MATRYCVLVTGNNNYTNTATWSANPNGSPTGASFPVSTDTIYPSTAIATGATLTVDTGAQACNVMDWSNNGGATNSPTLTLTNAISFYGNITFIYAMTINGVSYFSNVASTPNSITTNGVFIGVTMAWNQTSTSTLQDNVNNYGQSFYLYSGVLNTNNNNIVCAAFGFYGGATAKTLTLGSSIINCTSVQGTGTNITLNPGTSIINCSGNFNGMGLTWATVNLPASSTFSSNNTIPNINIIEDTSLNFNGVNNVVTAPNISALSPSVVSVECWVYLNVTGVVQGATQDIVVKTHSGPPYFSYLLTYYATNELQFAGYLSNGIAAFDAHVFNFTTTTKWLHLVGVYDGNYGYLYVNGVLVGQSSLSSGTLFTSKSPIAFGAWIDATSPLNGLIDGIRVYNRAMTTSEIVSNFILGRTNHPTPSNLTGLIAWYKMYEGDGTNIYDFSGNNNTGTISGATWSIYDPTITATGTTQTVGSVTRTGVRQMTIAGGTWISSSAQPVILYDMSISNSTAQGLGAFYAGVAPPSTNGGGNTGWIFGTPTAASPGNRSRLSEVWYK